MNVIGNNILNEWFYNNFLRYRSSSVYNQLLIAHIMSKIIFMKYLPPARPKIVPKSKMLRIYWKLAHLIFRISWSWFWCQNVFLLNTYHCSAQIGSKIKSAQNLLKFGTFDISNMPISILTLNMIFINYRLLSKHFCLQPFFPKDWTFYCLLR